jgi:hypothetical protein
MNGIARAHHSLSSVDVRFLKKIAATALNYSREFRYCTNATAFPMSPGFVENPPPPLFKVPKVPTTCSGALPPPWNPSM